AAPPPSISQRSSAASRFVSGRTSRSAPTTETGQSDDIDRNGPRARGGGTVRWSGLAGAGRSGPPDLAGLRRRVRGGPDPAHRCRPAVAAAARGGTARQGG